MRLGRQRPPRRRDPRRQFRNHLLLGMVGVALLPLVAFALLAVFELNNVASSTANATEAAILQDQQANTVAALDGRADSLDRTMGAIDMVVQEELTATLVKSLSTTPPAPSVKLTPASTYISLPANTKTDAKFGSSTESAAVAAEVTLVLKNNPDINSVWFENQKTGALRIYPAVPTGATVHMKNVFDLTQPAEPGLQGVLASSEGGPSLAALPNHWVDPNSPGITAGGPFWTDPYPLIDGGLLGVSAWYQATSILIGVDVSLSKLILSAIGPTSSLVDPLIISATDTVIYASPQSAVDFPNLTAGDVFKVPQPRLINKLRQMEVTGAVPQAPLAATLNKVTTEVFTAPVYSGHWIVANPVPLSALEPNLNALSLGINASVHRLFPVMVLPVLLLLVVLAFIATTLLSKRMYLPVQALTDHAVLEERTRLAREIHDTLAQQLTGIVLKLEAADTLLQRGAGHQARESVEQARELARGALQEARSSVWNLRPAPLSAAGLVDAIHHEVEAWEERTGIPARFKARSVPLHPPLSPTAEVAFLRISQEALSNAARHGHPTKVDVELQAQAQELILSIRDDGIGFDPSASAPREDCFGLDAMADRARNAGGTFTVTSAPSHGTTVTARLPFTEKVAEANVP